ncbi:MAG: c-type cytochrome [Hyphomicrobiales bacterium]
MRAFLKFLVLLAIAGAVVFWFITQPKVFAEGEVPPEPGNAERGEYVFYASGCASCHAAPGAKGEDKLKLAGGLSFKTPFGTFYAPNVSPDEESGIGGWSNADFANAVMRGVSPDGAHYYPAFPYASYQRMNMRDVVDLKAFMDTLEPVKSEVPDHDLPLPFRFRRALGGWKFLFADNQPFKLIDGADDKINRGAYLVTGPGHCGECHTPRNLLGGPDKEWQLSGGPAPEGEGFIPNITPHKDGLGGWSEADIASSLETGFTPEYDSFGGSMVAVQENMAKLTVEDRAAIAAYLKTVEPRPNRWKKRAPAQ